MGEIEASNMIQYGSGKHFKMFVEALKRTYLKKIHIFRL
jgi:hypothetical protein